MSSTGVSGDGSTTLNRSPAEKSGRCTSDMERPFSVNPSLSESVAARASPSLGCAASTTAAAFGARPRGRRGAAVRAARPLPPIGEVAIRAVTNGGVATRQREPRSVDREIALVLARPCCSARGGGPLDPHRVPTLRRRGGQGRRIILRECVFQDRSSVWRAHKEHTLAQRASAGSVEFTQACRIVRFGRNIATCVALGTSEEPWMHLRRPAAAGADGR